MDVNSQYALPSVFSPIEIKRKPIEEQVIV